MAPTSGELYNYRVMPSVIVVDVLFPNGLIYEVKCSREDRLKQIKERAFELVDRRVCVATLASSEKYVLISVNQDAQREEYHDETRRLCDLRLFLPVLRLVERVGDPDEARRNAEVARIIGFGSASAVGDNQPGTAKVIERSPLLTDPECIAFRLNVFEELRRAILVQRSNSRDRVALAAYPPDWQADSGARGVGDGDLLKININATMASGLFVPGTDLRAFEEHLAPAFQPVAGVEVQEVVCRPTGSFVQFRLRVRADCTLRQVLDTLVCVTSCTSGADAFVLKVAGCLEYVTDLERPIGALYSARIGAAARTRSPEFVLVSREAFVAEAARRGTLDAPPTLLDGVSMLRDRTDLINSVNTARPTWSVEQHIRLRISSVAYVQMSGTGATESALFVRAGLYQGGEALCEPPVRDTRTAELRDARWNETIEFPINLADLPRTARLTLTLFNVGVARQRYGDASEQDKDKDKEKEKEKPTAIGFANLPLFTFDRTLLLGRQSVRLWPISNTHLVDGDVSHATLATLATTGSFPDRHDPPTLTIELLAPEAAPDATTIERAMSFSPQSSSTVSRKSSKSPFTLLVFPSDDLLDTYAKRAVPQPAPRSSQVPGQTKKRLDDLVLRGPIALEEFSDQEKQLIRESSTVLRDVYPDSLPKVCMAVRWNCRMEVLQFYELLRNWPPISLETALQLLDAQFTDLRVRTKAVEALHRLNDTLLSTYLLQLTQALRFEPYADSALARFLLRRALANQRIGQAFFWHLKADLHQPAVRLRHALLLDAYLHCCGDSMRAALVRQCDALTKLTLLTEQLRDEQDRRGELKKDDAKKFLQGKLSGVDCLEFVQHLPSPISQAWQLDVILIPFCKVMKSKKKPLWLVWRNGDEFSEAFLKEFMLIFKNGDDLRQDMLTLQILGVMDTIWKQQGKEMYITPYSCLATGRQTGLIEVVQKSDTVMNIIRLGKGPAKYRMNQWLLENNGGSTSERYRDAVNRFRYSCAAYCVATFVIGIGDRHPDNIMINQNGQIFHIDFGHFLNNKKKKFGFQRERVPFILRADFFTIMAQGHDATDDIYDEFKRLCITAYQGLRRHANLILTLFSLMVQAGIPELRSHADLDYLRLTLAVNKTDEQAEEYFSKQFDAAQKKAWTTTIDWWLHDVNRQLKK